MTDRISVTKSAPTTEFVLECDRVSQSVENNTTRLAIYLRAINRGNTSSFSNWPGTQTGSVDGVGTAGAYSANPFLPSGVGTGVQRWRSGPHYIDIPHGDDGTRGAVTLRQTLVYGNGAVNESATVSFNDFPAIPRGPRVKVAGVWKNTVAYVKVAGVWKIAIPYVKVAGIWKIGGG